MPSRYFCSVMARKESIEVAATYKSMYDAEYFDLSLPIRSSEVSPTWNCEVLNTVIEMRINRFFFFFGTGQYRFSNSIYNG